MQKHLILHIGTHKTGTTSIQNSLKENVEILDKNSISYVLLNTYRFVLDILKRPVDKQTDIAMFDDFNKSEYSTLLVSAERCSGTMADYNDNYNVLQNIKNIASKYGFKLTVIGYLRKQDSYLESAYMQFLKWGYKKKFAVYLIEFIEKQDWLKFTKKLQEIFKGDELILSPFARETLINSDVVADFWKKIGHDVNTLEGFVAIPNKNESYGFTALEVTRKMNPHTSTAQKKLIRQYLESISHDDKLDTLFNEEQHQRLQELYNDSNTELCNMMGWPEKSLRIVPKKEYFVMRRYAKTYASKSLWKLISDIHAYKAPMEGSKKQSTELFKINSSIITNLNKEKEEKKQSPSTNAKGLYSRFSRF
jgi:hypothetical protein